MELKVGKQEKLIKFLIHNNQGLSFGSAQKLLRLGKVKVNGKRTKDNIDLNIGDIIEIHTFQKSMPKVEILYEDDNILIVNKPQGIECATRDKSTDNTYSLEEIFEDKNAIVVHRLDRLTEGIVILAKNINVARKFETYFRNRNIDKYYQAGVHGNFIDIGIKKAYLKKFENKAIVDIKDTPLEGYKEIVTEIQGVTNYTNLSIVNIKLHTGRTHQIRAHLSHLGYPIINDNKYSNTPNFTNDYKGYFLTACKIKFNLNDDMSYLNELNIEIKPSWLKYF